MAPGSGAAARPGAGTPAQMKQKKRTQPKIRRTMFYKRRGTAPVPNVRPRAQRLDPASSLSLRRDPHLGRGGADIGVDVAFERHEILLEHGDQAAGGVVELRLALPCLVRIEQLRLDAG